MKKYLIGCLFMLAACTAGHRIMTTDIFSEMDVGMSEKELKQKAGDPYSVKTLASGDKEYEYIERVIVDDRAVESRHYFFIIKNGFVFSKKMVEGDKYKPLLDRNAYDLQTSSVF
jgi:hypothetical protein